MSPTARPTTRTRSTRTTALLAAGGALLLFALPATASGTDAVITVVFTADDMGFNATSSKDLSNIIVELCDGTTHKHDNLTGHSFVHNETQEIAGVWVKSGNNGIEGNDPPGAGERFDNAGACSSETSSSTSSSGTSTSGTTTTSTSETQTTTSETETTTSTEVPVFGTVGTLALGIGGALVGTVLMLRRRL